MTPSDTAMQAKISSLQPIYDTFEHEAAPYKTQAACSKVSYMGWRDEILACMAVSDGVMVYFESWIIQDSEWI